MLFLYVVGGLMLCWSGRHVCVVDVSVFCSPAFLCAQMFEVCVLDYSLVPLPLVLDLTALVGIAFCGKCSSVVVS